MPLESRWPGYLHTMAAIFRSWGHSRALGSMSTPFRMETITKDDERRKLGEVRCSRLIPSDLKEGVNHYASQQMDKKDRPGHLIDLASSLRLLFPPRAV